MAEQSNDQNQKDVTKKFEGNANVSTLDNIYSVYTLDNLTSVSGMFRTVATQFYKENSLKKINRYNGQILRVDKIKASDAESNNSFNLQFVKELKPDTVIVTYKVRIPAIDGALPIPSLSNPNDAKSNKIIDLYPDYTSEFANDEFNVGDYVEIEFDNDRFLTDGRIVSSYKSQFQSTQVGAASAGDASTSGLNTDASTEQKILSNENSYAQYKKGITPVALLTKTKQENSYTSRKSIPKNFQFAIADVEAESNRFPGPLAGKDRKILLARVHPNQANGQNHFMIPRARDQLTKMGEDYNEYAKANNLPLKHLTLSESFRCFDDQIAIYNRRYSPSYQEVLAGKPRATKPNINGYGPKQVAAFPGRSDHQRGIAVDFNGTEDGTSQLYKWLIENGWKYGFRRTVKGETFHFDYRDHWIGVKPPEEVSAYENNKIDTPTGLE